MSQPHAIENATSYNESLYEDLWGRMASFPHEKFPWWPVFKELTDNAADRLEIGPGVFPRFPTEGTHVCDLSKVSLDVLAKRGAIVHHGLLQDQGFADRSFDLVGMFEVLEHVADDEGLLREIARLTRPGGRLALTVPLGMKHYCSFDRYMGHVRRFEPGELRSKVERAGYRLERFEIHQQSNKEPAASVYVFMMQNFPRFTAWMLRHVFLPMISKMKLDWYDDPALWETKTKDAMDVGAIFVRV